MRHQIENFIKHRNRQTGALTIFTAIMVLLILTLMIFYAARVGLFAQRISANEVRQKIAFNAAEAALEQGVEYILANAQLIISSAAGDAGSPDGWFAPGKERWQLCPDPVLADHQCGGANPMKPGSYYYGTGGAGIDSILPIGTVPGFAADVTVRLSANMCFVSLGDPDASPCLGKPGTAGAESSSYMIITLLGYGYSDCTNLADVSTCQGRATVAKPVANFKQLAGSPTVPMVAKSTFPPTGTANVVPNPNGGGVGVPISVWVNANPVVPFGGVEPKPYCPQLDLDVLSKGTWNTCEMQEWYHRNEKPERVACPDSSCKCDSDAESISYANDKEPGNTPKIGIDIVRDTTFPCDLFLTFFGTPRDDFELVKLDATEVPDCGDDTILGPSSSGLYWITDPACTLNTGEIGAFDDPVVLIAEGEVRITGQVDIFGVLYLFDGPDNLGASDLSGAGRASIYGALIVDSEIDKFAGTLDVVYADDVLLQAAGINGIGAINGGWRDFGLPDLDW